MPWRQAGCRTGYRPQAGHWPRACSSPESTYQYRPYRGPTVFIQGTIRGALVDFLNADGLNGWGGLFEGPLTRLELPMSHFVMMRPPLVTQITEILRAL